MGEIRGERVSFRRQDITPLHRLPSAQVEDPLIVHCPPRIGLTRRLVKLGVIFSLMILLALSSIMMVIEGGGFDSALSARAQAALNTALAPNFIAQIETTEVRFSHGIDLAVEARGVTVRQRESDGVFAQADRVRMVIDPVALVLGRVEINEIDGEGIDLDANLMSSGPPVDLSTFRIDALPALMERSFLEIDNVSAFIERGGLDRLRLADLQISRGAPSVGTVIAAVDTLVMERTDEMSLAIEAAVAVAGQPTSMRIDSERIAGRTERMTARLEGLDLAPLMLKRSSAGEIRQGIDADATVELNARRTTADQAGVLSATITGADGLLYMDGQSQVLTSADIRLAYDFTKDTVELRPSRLAFEDTILPFSGALIDLDRLERQFEPGAGIGIDLLVQNGTASVAGVDAPPAPFDFKAYGRYLHQNSELQVDTLVASTPGGTLSGSARIRNRGEGSPEVSFSAEVSGMKTDVVKQLWPFWIASKPRSWVIDNLVGGRVTQGSIGVFIPAGRMTIEPTPLHLRGNELRLALDVVDSRVAVTGDIPPVRDASARVVMNGETLDVEFKSGASYFTSGRRIKLDGGRLAIADVYQKPLMADIDLSLQGSADAVAELVTYKPINVLSRTGLTPEDLSGDVKAQVKLHVGLIRSQNPPPTDWNVHIDLDQVSVKTEFAGRKVSAFDGVLDIDPKAARLSGKGDIDDVPMELSLVEPVDSQSDVARERVVKAVLSNETRDRLVPGLDGIVDGPMAMTITRVDETRQRVELDLARARLSVPWVGWTKGQGVSAKATFEISNGDGTTRVMGLDLSGDGFGASGELVIANDGLQSADFRQVRLSQGDDYAVHVAAVPGGYDVSVKGTSADLRSLIARLKSGSGSKDESTKPRRLTISANLDSIAGFGGERLSNVSLNFAANNGRTTTLDFTGVTGSGQAVVAQMTPGDTRRLSLTTSDAGAVLRLANLYSRMQGGLLNLKLASGADDQWNGSLDIRNFQLMNEQRLQSIVSTPTGADGRSLNKAVKRDIDVSSERFQRAYARLINTAGALRVENGVVRGEQVGATFQGVLRDESGRIDMTGTFMPAYGLNRLFGELPIIGAILGNGRDRGLLGITFRLSGPTEEPKLSVNPLSIIAPGVFRQIFEFR